MSLDRVICPVCQQHVFSGTAHSCTPPRVQDYFVCAHCGDKFPSDPSSRQAYPHICPKMPRYASTECKLVSVSDLLNRIEILEKRVNTLEIERNASKSCNTNFAELTSAEKEAWAPGEDLIDGVALRYGVLKRVNPADLGTISFGEPKVVDTFIGNTPEYKQALDLLAKVNEALFQLAGMVKK